MGFLVALVVGYYVAVFAASNILLPLLWAWPLAQRLYRAGRLAKEIPATRFVVAPVFWTVILFLSIVAYWKVFPAYGIAYLLGLLAGWIKISALVNKPSKSMEEDFAATYREFLK